MSEIKQADPASILLPLSQYATQPEDENKCLWPLEKGPQEGEPCGRKCTFGSTEYCSAHNLCAKRRAAASENKVEASLFTKHDDGKVSWAQYREEAEDHFASHDNDPVSDFTPQEVQNNTEKLLKLQLLKSMMDLLQDAFKLL